MVCFEQLCQNHVNSFAKRLYFGSYIRSQLPPTSPLDFPSIDPTNHVNYLPTTAATFNISPKFPHPYNDSSNSSSSSRSTMSVDLKEDDALSGSPRPRLTTSICPPLISKLLCCLCCPTCSFFVTRFFLFAFSAFLLNLVCHTSTESPFYGINWGWNPYLVLFLTVCGYLVAFNFSRIREYIEQMKKAKKGDEDSISLTDITGDIEGEPVDLTDQTTKAEPHIRRPKWNEKLTKLTKEMLSKDNICRSRFAFPILLYILTIPIVWFSGKIAVYPGTFNSLLSIGCGSCDPER